MKIRSAKPQNFPQLALWNRQLQEDEGAHVMSIAAIEARLEDLLLGNYEAVVFIQELPVGYALYRKTDPDSEGGGVYIRQFHIDRTQRRKGYGSEAFRLLKNQFLGGGRVILETLETNPSGHAFWRSLGFKPYSTKYEIQLDGTVEHRVS